MPLQTFNIELDKSTAVYVPGETIGGSILLELTQPQTCRGIKVKFGGRARVHWKTLGESVNCRKSEEYFQDEVYVVGSSDGEIELATGQHIFPFTCSLPANIPSTFNHKYGRIEYSIKALLDVVWAANYNAYHPLTVTVPFQLNQSQTNSIRDELYEDYSCCLFPFVSQGSLEACIFVPETTYDIGEKIEVFIDMTMSSLSVEILGIELQLRQNMIYDLAFCYIRATEVLDNTNPRHGSCKVVVVSSATVDGFDLVIENLTFSTGSCAKIKTEILHKTVKSGPFHRNHTLEIGLQVPSTFHPHLQHCSIIKVTSHLGVKFIASGGYHDTKKEYDIRIGPKSHVFPIGNGLGHMDPIEIRQAPPSYESAIAQEANI